MPVTLLTSSLSARSLRILVRGRYWSEFEQQFGLLFRTKHFNMNKHDDSAKKLRRALRPARTQPAYPAADDPEEPQSTASAGATNGATAASAHMPKPPSSGHRSVQLPCTVRRRVTTQRHPLAVLFRQWSSVLPNRRIEARIQNTEHKHDVLFQRANRTVLDAEMLRRNVLAKVGRLKKAKIDNRLEENRMGHLGLSPRGDSAAVRCQKQSVFTSLTARSPAVDMLFPRDRDRDPALPVPVPAAKRRVPAGGILAVSARPQHCQHKAPRGGNLAAT
jgi:hypothetical protein